MMPNIDPRQLKSIMDKMGMKSTSIDAENVVIHCSDRDIVIDEPQVTMIEMQGSTSFQIAGSVRDVGKAQPRVEISDEDVRLVSEKTGVTNEEQIRAALQASNGNIAEAIIKLKEEEPID